MRKVYQIEEFSGPLGIPADVEEKAKHGDVELYNAPKFLPGHEAHQGEFRHGVFYAVLYPGQEDALELYERIRQLDGHLMVFWTQDEILEEMQAHYDQHYAKYGINVNDCPIKDVIHSWLNLQRQKEQQ